MGSKGHVIRYTVLNIRKVSVNGITIDTTGGDDYLVTGRAAGLSAIVTPADATEKGVIWSSDPEDVASVYSAPHPPRRQLSCRLVTS